MKVEGPEYLSASSKDRMHKSEDDKYVAYVDAFVDKCVIVDIPDGEEANINLLLLNSAKPLNVRLFFRVGNNSKLNVFQYFGSETPVASCLLGTIHEVQLGSGSEVEINALHNEDSKTVASLLHQKQNWRGFSF